MRRNASLGQNVSTGLLIIRLIIGVVFVYHGCQILFGAWGGPGPKGFAAFLRLPSWMGYAVGAAQLGGALAILTGILFEVGCMAIIVVMAGAVYLVHWHNGFSIQHDGMEYALTQGVVALGLLFGGPGSYSLLPVSHGPETTPGNTVPLR